MCCRVTWLSWLICIFLLGKCLWHTLQHLHLIHAISKNKKNCDLKFWSSRLKPEVKIFLIFRKCNMRVIRNVYQTFFFLVTAYAISSNKVAILSGNMRNPICALLSHVLAKTIHLSCQHYIYNLRAMSDSNPVWWEMIIKKKMKNEDSNSSGECIKGSMGLQPNDTCPYMGNDCFLYFQIRNSLFSRMSIFTHRNS